MLAGPRRFERLTFPLGGGRSVQLSYGPLWARQIICATIAERKPKKKAQLLLGVSCQLM